MNLDLNDPELAALHARLAPYAGYLLVRAASYAAAQHADEVGPEHLLSTLMEHAECAAHRTVLFAFADPDTIAAEARALSSGILVSGSRATVPFSMRGVEALRAARARAAEERGPTVRLAHLLWAAVAALPAELRDSVEQAGFASEALERLPRPAPSPQPVAADGPLFRYFDNEAKQALLQASRLTQDEQPARISPAHLALAALRGQPDLEQAAGLSAARLRVLLHGHATDDGSPPAQELAADDALLAFLGGLPPGATSLDLLGQYHAGPTAELSELLLRHKVSLALLARTEQAYSDPEEPPL